MKASDEVHGGVDAAINDIARHVSSRYSDGQLPLFVVGAGISAQVVPLLGFMATALAELIAPEAVPEATKTQLLREAKLIAEGAANRSDAAEFFSTLQMREKPLLSIWDRFCEQLVISGLAVASEGDLRRFNGLLTLKQSDSTDAHVAIAQLLARGHCHVLNLNYDPLLHLALTSLEDAASASALSYIPLYTVPDIRAYYTAETYNTFQPCVTNARGDVFYARCTNLSCPRRANERMLEFSRSSRDTVFVCPTCHQHSMRLQLSFPSYEMKERMVEPLLAELRRYVGFTTSAIITLGISGTWDPYLLQALFEWATAHEIPIIDVKPKNRKRLQSTEAFDAFRKRFFPTLSEGLQAGKCCYVRLDSRADEFMTPFVARLRSLSSLTLPSQRDQMPLFSLPGA